MNQIKDDLNKVINELSNTGDKATEYSGEFKKASQDVNTFTESIKNAKNATKDPVKPKVDTSDFDKLKKSIKDYNTKFGEAFSNKKKIDTKQIDQYLAHVKKMAQETGKITETTFINLSRLSEIDLNKNTYLNGKKSDPRIKEILSSVSTKEIANIAKHSDTSKQYIKYFQDSLAEGIKQIPQYKAEIDSLFFNFSTGAINAKDFASSFDLIKKEAAIAIKPLHEIIIEMKNAPNSMDFKNIISKKLNISRSGGMFDYFDKMFNTITSGDNITKIVSDLTHVKQSYQDLQDTLQNKKNGMKNGTFVDISVFKDLVDVSKEAKEKVGELYDVIYQRRRIETGKNAGKYLEAFKLIGEKNWAWVGKNGELLNEQYHIANELTETKLRQKEIDKEIGQEQSRQTEAYTNMLKFNKLIASTTNEKDRLAYTEQYNKELQRICSYQESINSYETEYVNLLKKRYGITDKEASQHWTDKMKFSASQNGNISILDPKLQARAERNSDISKIIKSQTEEKIKQAKSDEKQKKDELERRKIEAEITEETKKQIDSFNKALEYEKKAAEVSSTRQKKSFERSAEKEWQRIADIQDKIIEKQGIISDFSINTPFAKSKSGLSVSMVDENIIAKYNRNKDEIERISLKKQEMKEEEAHERLLKEQEQTAKNILNLEKQRIENEREAEKARQKQVLIDATIAKYRRQQEAKDKKQKDQEIQRLRNESKLAQQEKEKAEQNSLKSSEAEQRAIFQAIQDKRVQINYARLRQDEEQVKSLEMEKTKLVERLAENEKRLKILNPSYSRQAVAEDFNKMRDKANTAISKDTNSFYENQLRQQLSLFKEMQKIRMQLYNSKDENVSLKERLSLLKEEFERRAANLKLIDEEKYKDFQITKLANLAFQQSANKHQVDYMRSTSSNNNFDNEFASAQKATEQEYLNAQRQLWQNRLAMKGAGSKEELEILKQQDAILSHTVVLSSERLKTFNDERAVLNAEEKALKIQESYINKINGSNTLQDKISRGAINAENKLTTLFNAKGQYNGIDSWIEQFENSVKQISVYKAAADNAIGKPWYQRLDEEQQISKLYDDEILKLNKILTIINSIKRDPDSKYVKQSAISKQIATMEDFYSKNDGASKRMKSQLREVIDEMNLLGKTGKVLPKDFDAVVSRFNEIQATMKKTGDTGMSIATKLGKAWKAQMASQIAMYTSFYSLIRYARNAFDTIKDLDTALVDLRKTTTMSGRELNDFYYQANESAKKLGVTTKEVIQQAADWSRLNKIGPLYSNV